MRRAGKMILLHEHRDGSTATHGCRRSWPERQVVVHGQDIRRPLGLESTVPDETIEVTLSHIKKDKIREDYRARCGG